MLQPSIDRATSAGHQITFHTIKFPMAEVGLPEGIEDFSSLTSAKMMPKLYRGIYLLQKTMEQLVRDIRPDCIVSDMFLAWTVVIAEELNIPRIMLYVNNSFYHSVFHNLMIHKPHEKVGSDSESFVVPGLPDEIEKMTRSQLEAYLKTETWFGKLMNRIKELEIQSYGVVFSSYFEIEPDYVQYYKNVVGRKCWHVGLPWKRERKRERNGYGATQLLELARQSETQFSSVLILTHLVIAGFVTHCGWNSLLEEFTTGVPLITWPLFADKFYNEKLVTTYTGLEARGGSRVGPVSILWTRVPHAWARSFLLVVRIVMLISDIVEMGLLEEIGKDYCRDYQAVSGRRP
ncbi:hypothetical protein RHMOL_Rhmol06G0066200 [Rhododendron molle]|uniref:Uncharacterized protein n=1 Tax=Rhododendron molle TaxID=49168 RepID=A0ACC0N9T2_RHOML|nr:hypothetical protein RHMOL_Rhmol06G0066200 [Rhododendron molle]